MRIAAFALLAAVAIASAACSPSEMFRRYEYEEEIFLALDGSATVYVNTSVAALNALRGATFDADPSAQIDRDAVGAYLTTPVTRLARRPSVSRRSGRRFVHVRIDVDRIEDLGRAAPFAWSTYRFRQDGELYTFTQKVGKPAGGATIPDWTDADRVAFRLHLPSAVVWHNAGAENLRRGNILVWEQSLSERLRGEPLEFEARMESQSILSRTLLLFGATALAVALMFVVIIVWVMRRGRPAA